MSFHIDPKDGKEAAADIPNEQFQTLLRIVVWELAMRTSPEQFEDHLRQLAGFRAGVEPDLEEGRRERDQRRFVASVLSDIESLPTKEASRAEPTTGLYL